MYDFTGQQIIVTKTLLSLEYYNELYFNLAGDAALCLFHKAVKPAKYVLTHNN